MARVASVLRSLADAQRWLAEPPRHALLVKLSRWLIFNVIFALLPFGVNAFHLAQQPGGWNHWYELWPRGELLLVCVAIAADALGELVGNREDYPLLKLYCGGICAAVLFLAAAWFSDVQFSAASSPPGVSKASLWVYLLTMIVAGACKVLAELRPPKPPAAAPVSGAPDEVDEV